MKIPIHFSCYKAPKTLELSGYAEEVIAINNPCPSFRELNSSSNLTIDFNSKIKDEKTNESISNYSVTLIKDGLPVVQKMNQKKDSFNAKIPLGLYYIIIEKEGYETFEKLYYVNRRNNNLTIPLIPIKTNTFTENSIITIADSASTIEITTKKTKPLLIDSSKNIITTSNTKEFNEINYEPNNIVFLLDISTSMKYNGKLELLKSSMQELTKILRPIDKVTIIGYSSRASVLLNTISGNEKDSIAQKIIALKSKRINRWWKRFKTSL